MPVHMNFKLLQALQRKRVAPVIEASVEHLRVMFRDGQQHVSFTHNAARRKIVLAAQNDPALAARAIQFGVHQAGAETSRRDQNILPEIRVKIQLTLDGRMPFARHDHHAIRKQRLLAKIVTDGNGNIQNKGRGPLASSCSISRRLTRSVVMEISGAARARTFASGGRMVDSINSQKPI